jgi:signal transduction histidine kinase
MSVSSARAAGPRAAAFAAGALGVAAAFATAAFGVANWHTSPSLSAFDLPSAVIPISFGILGALVASREPRNITGWLFLFIAVGGGLQGTAVGYARFALVAHPGAPGGIWALWAGSWLIDLVFPAGALALLLLVFPDGRLPSRRWKPLAVFAVILTVVIAIPAGALAPGPLQASTDLVAPSNPLGLPVTGAARTVLLLLGFLWFAGFAVFIAAAAAPLVRMRRSRGHERQQLKWIAYAVIVTALVYVPFIIPTFFFPVFPSWTSDLVISLGFGVAVPVAAGIAILKHRLFDIDLVINRTLVYGALALFITAVYIGIAVGVGALVGGGGKSNLGLSILATAIVAVGFQPVRQRLQKVANRLVYGMRATPYEVLSRFSERVAESFAVDDVLPRMARVLAEGTGAQRADVWLHTGTVLRAAASWPPGGAVIEPVALMTGTLPPLPNTDRVVEVRQQNELLGALGVTKRGHETLTPIEEKLLADLAHQAGLVLRNVRLTADLQARLDDLRASRQRLVAAQDHERRRIERNLHDGAQQHLVALKVKLGLVKMLTTRDPERANATIIELERDADEALETLRDLARGIYPPLLAEQGLAMALRSQARKAMVPVQIDADGVGRYPEETEAAVYFCILEALQNVQKYAMASGVEVRLREEGEQLLVEVADDGCGFDVTTTVRGSGLTNMEDRLDALGGTIQIESTRGAGTTLRVTLPVSHPPVAAN